MVFCHILLFINTENALGERCDVKTSLIMSTTIGLSNVTSLMAEKINRLIIIGYAVPLAYPVLMTFPKVSGGGRVCDAASRGQREMLQQIYSLWGGGVEWEDRGGRWESWGRARMDILP